MLDQGTQANVKEAKSLGSMIFRGEKMTQQDAETSRPFISRDELRLDRYPYVIPNGLLLLDEKEDLVPLRCLCRGTQCNTVGSHE